MGSDGERWGVVGQIFRKDRAVFGWRKQVFQLAQAFAQIPSGQLRTDGARPGAGAINDSLLFNRHRDGLVANQLLTDFGRTRNLVADSRLQEQAATQTTQASRYDVTLGVNRTYYGVLESQG
jgi:outer membrane protein TolC